jgi:tellurite resistance protein TerC
LTLKQIKKLIVAVIGFTILAIGIVMIIFPGPAFIVIPIGLSILATEFVWARKAMDKVKDRIKRTKDSISRSK